MIEPPYSDIINGLISATKKQNVAWNQTSIPDQYKAVLPSGTVTVYLLTDDEYPSAPYDTPDAIFTIYNTSGLQVYSSTVNGREGNADFRLLSELHSVASNSYLRKDQTIDGLISDLLPLK